jgi:hypothetical protein
LENHQNQTSKTAKKTINLSGHLVVGTLVWYLPDTGLSLYFGVTFNAVVNTIFLAIIALPLIFTRREFAR